MCSEPAEEGSVELWKCRLVGFVRMFVGGGDEGQLGGRFCWDE